MKLVSKVFLGFLLLSLFSVSGIPTAFAETNAPSRIINVVYDDSGSMISSDGQQVDTWCQAKYAMEVFAAMLGTKDVLNIYVMSDFTDSNLSVGPKIVLNGQEGARVNVAKVHNMVTRASSTPFNTVRKAYTDLNGAAADEKWLVVLTDGEFQGIDNLDAYFAQKNPNIKIMFLSMGPSAGSITENEAAGIFFEKAQTNSQILSKITGICTRIFNSDRLEVNPTDKTFSFDVPMSELVVFAQGANVSIDGVKNAQGELIKYSSEPVSVRYSEQAATNYTDVKIATDLVGAIATFNEDFPPGQYTVSVSGAQTVEIYYRPNVEISAYLVDANNNEVTALENLEAGEYLINFGFVKSGTKEQVPQSKLLGNVTYIAKVVNNGVEHEKAYTSGDRIYLEEGSLTIDATANFLEYNSVSTFLEYLIYQNKDIQFSVRENPAYTLDMQGMDTSAPIQIQATLAGGSFTEAQWGEMGIPTVTVTDFPEFELGEFRVEKSAETGLFNLYPALAEGKPAYTTYANCNYRLEYGGKHGNETWSGNMEDTLVLHDTRPWLIRHLQEIIKWGILALIVLFILGYIPPVKKYLPRRLKKRPLIDCSPNRPGIHGMVAKGQYKKSFLPTLIPYKAEKGTLKFVPPGVSGIASLKIRGGPGKSMYITNVKDYAGKDHITFDGVPVEAGKNKPIRKSSERLSRSITRGG